MFCLSCASMCIQIIRLSDEWKTYNWVTFSHNIGFLLHQNISQPQKDFLFLHSWILSEIINTSITSYFWRLHAICAAVNNTSSFILLSTIETFFLLLSEIMCLEYFLHAQKKSINKWPPPISTTFFFAVTWGKGLL